jgi:WD40 repeat protein
LIVGFEEEDYMMDVDYYNTNLIVAKDTFSLLLLSCVSYEVKQKIELNEEIQSAKWSFLKDRLLILTKRGKIKFYHASYSKITFLRDFSCLHEGGIKDFIVPLNCGYCFTIGATDEKLKVWDYNFRGGLTPSCQSFTINEQIQLLELSNDDNGYIFTVTANSPYVNTWSFRSSFVDMNLRSHAEQIEASDMDLLNIRKDIEHGAEKSDKNKKMLDFASLQNPDIDPIDNDLPLAKSKEVNHLHITGDYSKFSEMPEAEKQRIRLLNAQANRQGRLDPSAAELEQVDLEEELE